jgi:hypothetical protein
MGRYDLMPAIGDEDRELSPFELFSMFFKDRTNHDMTDEQTRIARELMEAGDCL